MPAAGSVVLSFLSMREARTLRLVSRQLLADVAAHPWEEQGADVIRCPRGAETGRSRLVTALRGLQCSFPALRYLELTADDDYGEHVIRPEHSFLQLFSAMVVPGGAWSDLRTLRLTSWYLYSAEAPLLERLVARLPRLSALSLTVRRGRERSSGYLFVDDLAPVLRAAPQLVDLHLAGPQWGEEEELAVALAAAPRLEALHLETLYLNSGEVLAAALGALTRLRTLKLSGVLLEDPAGFRGPRNPNGSEHLASVLSACRGLHALVMDCTIGMGVNTAGAGFELAGAIRGMPHLQRLKLTDSYFFLRRAPAVTFVQECLTRLAGGDRALCLTHLSVGVRDARGVAALISSGLAPRLCALELQPVSGSAARTGVVALWRALPTLASLCELRLRYVRVPCSRLLCATLPLGALLVLDMAHTGLRSLDKAALLRRIEAENARRSAAPAGLVRLRVLLREEDV